MDNPLLDPSIFSYLEAKITEEQKVRDALTDIVHKLDRAVARTQGLLSKVHSTPQKNYPELVQLLENTITDQVSAIKELESVASEHPYYKYNNKWSRTVQNAIGTAIYTGWLGGFHKISSPRVGRLLTLEEVGEIYNVPTNLKSQDQFHLTLEEYLLSLPDLSSDLARLATNSVTLGDFQLALLISAFIKDLFAGFQLLNLKNDMLRKRGDALKYDVKRVEDVVYDLSLRGLVQRPGQQQEGGGQQTVGGSAADEKMAEG